MDNTIPLFTAFYGKLGFFRGELNFTSQPDSDVSGSNFAWLRPPNAHAAYYPAGWPTALNLDVFGALFHPTATMTAASSMDFHQGAADPRSGNARLVFSDGALNGMVAEALSLDPAKGTVRIVPAGNRAYTFSLAAKTGIYSGTFLDTDGARDTYRGAIVNKGLHQGGFGYFLNPPPASAPGTGLSGNAVLLGGS
jgi:hypothetical protein